MPYLKLSTDGGFGPLSLGPVQLANGCLLRPIQEQQCAQDWLFKQSAAMVCLEPHLTKPLAEAEFHQSERIDR